eukprot:GHVR01151101.1.p1 GENE.GHVR01151101.1~~GHVR01151101.1.p1  ORF type:complete len:120 (-),score=19.68 GHVR01151101.1:169-528(-)
MQTRIIQANTHKHIKHAQKLYCGGQLPTPPTYTYHKHTQIAFAVDVSTTPHQGLHHIDVTILRSQMKGSVAALVRTVDNSPTVDQQLHHTQLYHIVMVRDAKSSQVITSCQLKHFNSLS